MGKKTCTKKRHSKDRAIAVLNTKKRKQLRLYRTAIAQPNNFNAMEDFLQSIHPEKVTAWLKRVQP